VATIGTPVRRREDYRFLTGGGTYTDDINRPGQLYAYILRSPHANARLAAIDTSAANAAPGVVAVYTAADMTADGSVSVVTGHGANLGMGLARSCALSAVSLF